MSSNSFIYKTNRPWPNPRLSIGAIVGHTTSNFCKLWFRTASPGEFIVFIFLRDDDHNGDIFGGFKSVPYIPDNLPESVRKIPFKIEDFSTDSTIVINIDALEPSSEYVYALYGTDGHNSRILLGQDYPHSFRTLSAEAKQFSFGFYSCHMPYEESIFGKTKIVNEEMWDCFYEMLNRHRNNLAYVIAGGDQVYADGVDSLNIWNYLNKRMRKDGDNIFPTFEEMVSWYRDIYRGYWGFESLKKVFASFPIYMIWDDHELADGWGSFYLKDTKDNQLNKILPNWRDSDKGLNYEDTINLLKNMFEAGKQVYWEYEHSHNPDTGKNIFDYTFIQGTTAFYIQDGRGNRDINKKTYKILGRKQLNRFINWLDTLESKEVKYLFIISAVPLLHLHGFLVNQDGNPIADWANLQDDLRDAWEHDTHKKERTMIMEALFNVSRKGIKVSILSGDVHTAAVFRIKDKESNNVIYQLTSSAITYNKSRIMGWLLGKGVPDEGLTPEGYSFERLALYTDSNFSLIRVDPTADEIIFQLYGMQKMKDPQGKEPDKPITHSITKLKLIF